MAVKINCRKSTLVLLTACPNTNPSCAHNQLKAKIIEIYCLNYAVRKKFSKF